MKLVQAKIKNKFHYMSNPLLKRAASSRGLDSTKGPFGIPFGPAKGMARRGSDSEGAVRG
jgi:hypothetical protein